VRNLLLLISRLDYSGRARRLCVLARGLPRDGFQVRVAVLETLAPWVESLRQAGVAVDVLNWRRPIDAAPFLALRRLLKTDRPDVVHAFGPAALRAFKLCGGRRIPLLASDLHRGGSSPRGWSLDRWLLGGKARVLAFGAAEALRYQRHGIAVAQIAQVTPGVELVSDDREAADWPAGRVLLCVGPIEAHKGYRDAVWAFDILQYLFADLRLAFLGDGSDRTRVADFAHAIGVANRITFLGKRANVEPYLRRAAAVWIPSRTGGGVCAALEALAAGRPVVASRTPELAEIIVDGQSGYLVPPGDQAALARQTRCLLGDAALAQRLGDAGKGRVAERFSAARLIAECARNYEQIAE
jgi:glycosyltransferase involved in cell wall biosynthesis